MDARRDVLPGLESGPPAYFRDWDTDQCRRYHVVNNSILADMLRQGPASLVALTDEDFTLEVRFGDDILFLGYDLATADGEPVQPETTLVVHPNETLHLTLYWRCLRPLDRDLYVFNHLVPMSGAAEMHGQEDGIPGHGWAPTSSWQAGEVIVDHWAVPVWPDAPASEDTLHVGIYDLASGARLPIWGPGDAPWGDHLQLGRILIPSSAPPAGP